MSGTARAASPGPAPSRRKRDVQAERTRAALVATARRLFVEQGYAATGTEAIVAAAGVGTRGALYHHFADKEALFAAVFDAVQAEVGARVVARVATGPTPAEGAPLATLTATIDAFLDCLVDDREAQAVLRDGPVALGWEAFRAAEVRYAAAAFQGHLDEAARSGTLVDVPTGPLARLLVAAVDEAAIALITADDQPAARHLWSRSLAALVAGLAAGR